MTQTVRVAAVQAAKRSVPYTIRGPAQALEHVSRNLDALVGLAERAAGEGCRIVAFPEDTLGTLEWEAGNRERAGDLLGPAEAAMVDRLGEVAAERRVCIVCCNDCLGEGGVYNTAILLGPDGCEIGRYRKVQLPIHEQARKRGDSFPVFEAPGIGPIGMCICYDMVFPETTRALALAGADIVFHLTMGGASMAGPEASLAAFRTRAADNFIYLVVAFRGGGSLIVGPRGDILADGGSEPDAVVMADIDPTAGRQAGDALGGTTEDFRARLFAERVPSAYGILTEERPPIHERLRHVPVPSAEEASLLGAEALTTGADAFYEAERWAAEGKIDAAVARFDALAKRFGTIWVGRAAAERLADLIAR
jgi:predicted amidohydrolase